METTTCGHRCAYGLYRCFWAQLCLMCGALPRLRAKRAFAAVAKQGRMAPGANQEQAEQPIYARCLTIRCEVYAIAP